MKAPTKRQVDKLADLCRAAKALNAQIEEAKEELRKMGVAEYIGDTSVITVTKAPRTSLNADVVRMYLTPMQLIEATVVTDVITVKVWDKK